MTDVRTRAVVRGIVTAALVLVAFPGRAVAGAPNYECRAAGGRHVNGACAFVPGNFALGHVSASRLVVRTTPADDATVVAVVRKGSLLWSPGRFNETTRLYDEETDGWTRVEGLSMLGPAGP